MVIVNKKYPQLITRHGCYSNNTRLQGGGLSNVPMSMTLCKQTMTVIVLYQLPLKTKGKHTSSDYLDHYRPIAADTDPHHQA